MLAKTTILLLSTKTRLTATDDWQQAGEWIVFVSLKSNQRAKIP
jgi:hypothetical protein